MRSLWLLAVFAVALLASLIAFAPLSLAMGSRGLTAENVDGTIWSGRLRGAALGPVSLGEVKAGLQPLGLLAGNARFRIAATGGAATGRGLVSLSSRSLTVRGLDAAAPLELLGAQPPFGGTLRTRAFGVAFEDGRCKAATGEVQADLQGLGDGVVTLAGSPACRGAALAIPLSGQRDGARVGVLLTLRADGRYRTETTVATAEPGFGVALEGAGFTKDAAGWRRATEGQLK